MLRPTGVRGIRPHIYSRAFPRQRRRHLANDAAQAANGSNETKREGWLFVDSILPVRLATWDPRYYIGLMREQFLHEELKSVLCAVKTRGFQYLALESRVKDGGVFVKFKYTTADGEEEATLQEIVESLRTESEKKGGLPSWIPIKQGNIWLVKGKPWREDMHRFASPILKVAYEGPDIYEEDLYALMRPYGRIVDLSNPAPVPAGTLRSSVVTFRQVRAAAAAHNCLHGLSIPSSTSPTTTTRLHTYYERPLKAHAIRDWISGHPRISIPVIVFLLGSLTYTIFDPIREFAVEAKMLDWLDYRKSKWYQWIQQNTLDRLPFKSSSEDHKTTTSGQGVWKERKDAENGLRAYLGDIPNALTFVHGPQGSGKTHMLTAVLKETDRPYLIIDCNELYKAGSDSGIMLSLARQTGYWPVFPFVNSLNNLIDIASMGLIGQKAGLSSSLETQVKELLDVVASGLASVSVRQQKRNEHNAKTEEVRKAEEAKSLEAQNKVVSQDAQPQSIAGNGVMSDLGCSDEPMLEQDYSVLPGGVNPAHVGNETEKDSEKEALKPRPQEVSNTMPLPMPIVIIKNYATKHGKDDVLEVISQWAGRLIENQVAHVVVMSDNRENAKQLTRALPSKPLNQIALSDADADSALSFVIEKLHEAGVEEALSSELMQSIERLGGRASDLEYLVHKVSNGQSVEDAVEDIIVRGVNELRKNAFGEDSEDAKSLLWSREQAWAVIKSLSHHEEIAYHDVLLDFPFKGDETALRNMEHAEVITIGTYNGRPSVIRPGRPVYRYVFERLVADPVFEALQEIAYNEKLMASAETTIKTCEDELLRLKDIGMGEGHWWSSQSGTAARGEYIAKKLFDAETKLEKLESKNVELKKILGKQL